MSTPAPRHTAPCAGRVAPARVRARRGSALLEAMFAGTILIAGLTALVSALPTAMVLIGNLRDVTHADRVAAATVEQVVMTWARAPARVPTTGEHVADDAGRIDPAGRFRVRWMLSRDRPITGHTLVEVTVTWTARTGLTRWRTLRTYVTGVPP